ncbi:hypothetical protein [Mesorhizobium sp. Cs1299R1N3]|uniref:hypothetical protein n=1 Tax=Mesorhizobium sp. Cs1299R1N3 TaxID=3015173 RepID=UPI00301BE83F
MAARPHGGESNRPVAGGLDDDDPRLAFIYQEAVRGLTHQQTVVENMNTRAGSLIFATAFANSLLGGAALSNGLGVWDWTAVTLLFSIGGLIVFMLWPYHQYTFRFDPEELLHHYVDGDKPTTISAMHRALALRIKADMASNWRIIQRLRVALQFALVFLLLDILAWLLAIAGV